MSKYLIGLIFAVGVGGWAYAQIQRRTGGNSQTSLMMASIAGVIAFLFIVIVFSLIS
jgi:hypothetical protein